MTSLSSGEVQAIAAVLADQAANAGEPVDYLRDLTSNRASLPDRWRREVAGRRADNLAVATRQLVRWAETKGINEADPRYTTLGSLLVPVLEDVGPDRAAGVVAIIVTHRLYRSPDVFDDLVARYQVPVPTPRAEPTTPDAATSGEDLQLQGAAERTPLLLDVDSLAEGVRKAASVCRVELDNRSPHAQADAALGTGFVVGSDLVLTAGHVVDQAAGRKIRLRMRSTTTAAGTLLAVRSETTRLNHVDLAILQTTTPLPPGATPLSLGEAPLPGPGDALAILQHPDGGPLRLALTANGVISVDPARHGIRYATTARGGSSGAPCFDEAWRLVAVHRAERSTFFGAVREGVLVQSTIQGVP
jgi:endonuclease G